MEGKQSVFKLVQSRKSERTFEDREVKKEELDEKNKKKEEAKSQYGNTEKALSINK